MDGSLFQDIEPVLSANEGTKVSCTLYPTDLGGVEHLRNSGMTVTPSNPEIRTSSLLRKANGAPVIISKKSLEKCKALFDESTSSVEAMQLTRQVALPSIRLFKEEYNRWDVKNIIADQNEEYTAVKRLKSPPSEELSYSSEVVYDLKWSPQTLDFLLQDIDKTYLLEDPVFLVGHPAIAYDSFSYFGRLKSLSVIDSSVAVSQDIEFKFDNESFTLAPTAHCGSDESLTADLSLLRQASCKNILKNIIDRLEASMTLSADDFNWVKMQLRWIALTLVSLERQKPRDYLFGLFLGNIVVFSVLWRCSLYFHTRFDYLYCENLKLEMVRRSPRRTRRVGAISHFSKRGSMSPLQRCSDILNLTWPLTVCFFSRNGIINDNRSRPMQDDSPIASADKTPDEKVVKQSKYQFEVSDGWWWTSVVIDEGLSALFEKSLLKDGFKIVIFNATFEIIDSGSKAAKKTIMKLSMNGVRKARGDAKLGFVHPKYLNRGIALKTIKPDAGAVYAIQFRVMYVTPMMCKLRFKTNNRRPVFLGPSEIAAFHNSQEKMKNNVLNKIEKSTALTLAHVLDAMGCDDNVTQAILNDEDPSGYCDDVRDEIFATRRRLPVELEKMKSNLYNEAMTGLECDEMYYTDVLALCATCPEYCWIRFQHGHGHVGDYASSENMDPSIAKGRQLFMTHLKPMRSPYGGSGESGSGGLCKTLLLQCNPNSTVKVLSSSRAGEVSSTYGIVADLRKYFRGSSDDNSAAGSEVSFEMALVEWSITEGDLTQGSSIYDFELIGYSKSRVCIIMKFCIYSKDASKSLPWLAKHSVVTVSNAIVDSVDRSKEIITVGRFDRTIISVSKEGGNSLRMTSLPHVAEEISRRVAALRSSCLFYPSVHKDREAESCSREHISDADVRIVSRDCLDVLVKVKAGSSSPAEWENMIISQEILRSCVQYEILEASKRHFNLAVVHCSNALTNNNSIQNDIYLRRIKWISIN